MSNPGITLLKELLALLTEVNTRLFEIGNDLREVKRTMATKQDLLTEIQKIVDLVAQIPKGSITPADLDPVLTALTALETAVAALVPPPAPAA